MLTQDFTYLREQYSLAAPTCYVGIGLHTGRHVTLRILPAGADHGIRFIRRDLPADENRFLARWDKVVGTVLSTTLGNRFGHCISTVEHLLAAFNGLGIDNAEVVLDGPEVPIVDGSAQPFVTALQNSGIKVLGVPRDVFVVRRPVRVQQGERWAELLPDRVPRISLSIEFPQQDIGHYRAHRAGHKLNNELLSMFMQDTRSWQRVAASDLLDGRINGFDQALMGVGGEEIAKSPQAAHRFRQRRDGWHELFDQVFDRSRHEPE